MKSLLLYASLAALLGGTVASAQEESSSPAVLPASFSPQRSAYSPNDVKVLGTLNDGETSRLVEYTRGPEYRAFVFEGNGHDQVEITLAGANHRTVIALADSTLIPIASGIGRLSATLPYHGPDTETFYILVKPASNQAARFAVHLKRVPASVQPADATR